MSAIHIHPDTKHRQVGDYRLICRVEDDRLVVTVGHRREIYRDR